MFLPALCSWAQDELEHRRRPSIIIGVCSETFKASISPHSDTIKSHLQHREHPGGHNKGKWDAKGVADDVCNKGENAKQEEGGKADDQQEIVKEGNWIWIYVSLCNLVIERDAGDRHGEKDGTFHYLCNNDIGLNVAAIIQNVHREAGGEGEKDKEDANEHAFR